MSNITIILTNNIGVLVAMLAVIFGLVKAIMSKNKQKVYTGIYDLIGDAELLYSKGPEKFDYVFKNAYNKIPKVLRFLISEDDIKRAIEYSLNKLQAYAILQNKAITEEAASIPAAQ